MLKKLLATLDTIEQPSTFCSSGKIPDCFLNLSVNNIGTIALPLIPSQAATLIEQCHQAPFGRGEKTLVDTDVRKVWELNPEQFSIGNPQWTTHLNHAVKKISEQLGLQNQQVIYELYKLLLYQPGDFFVPHRDTEKIDNMFATLIIVLPSKHEGGELIINHAGETKTFDFSGELNAHSISYATFFADCEHEVKPVTEGHRLCLVYNLAIENSTQQPLAPHHNTQLDKITDILKDWATQPEQNDKLAIVFDHHYSQAGLSFNSLKSIDKTKAQLLVQAAEKNNCHAYLGLLTLWESGDLEEPYYGRDRHYFDPESAEMGEIYDESLSVKYWVDSQNIQQDLGEIQIDESELVIAGKLNTGEPDKKEVEGPTGNAGNTMDRWYHRGAIIIWRNSQHFSTLAHSGQSHAIPQLKNLLLKNTPDIAASTQQFAQIIIENWKKYQYHTDTSDNNQCMLQLLLDINDKDLIQKFITDILITELNGSEGKLIAEIYENYGWELIFNPLLELSNNESVSKITAFSQILWELISFPASNKTEQQTYCLKLAHSHIKQTLNLSAENNNYYYNQNTSSQKQNIIKFTFKSLYKLNAHDLLNRVASSIIENEFFNFYDDLIPVQASLYSFFDKEMEPCPAHQKVFTHILQRIKTKAITQIPEPSHWKSDQQPNCDCADCESLALFMHNPDLQVKDFKMAQGRRSHLEKTILYDRLDINCSTRKQGTPHTLVCTKNRNSYHAALKQQQVDIKLLATLEKMQPDIIL